jgi:hypothetical protein
VERNDSGGVGMGRSRSGGDAEEAVKASGRADCVGSDLASRGFLSLCLPGGLRRRRIRRGGGGAGERDAEEEGGRSTRRLGPAGESGG